MKNYEITNLTNYIKNYDINEYSNIISAYESIINEFIVYSLSSFFIQKKDHLLFVIKRGIETINNCFIQLLMYTKNLELVSFHCKKAFYYYIEFIGQINDDTHSYLQLTSKDAILFVYKKTIFDIDISYRRNFIMDLEDDKFIKTIHKTSNAINKIVIQYLFIGFNNDNLDKNKFTKNIIKDTKDIIKLLKNKNIPKFIDSFLIFEKFISRYNFNNCKYLLLCKYLIKKSFKKSLILDKGKLLDENFDLLINNYSELKFINWLLISK
jgi:hypothetical protein